MCCGRIGGTCAVGRHCYAKRKCYAAVGEQTSRDFGKSQGRKAMRLNARKEATQGARKFAADSVAGGRHFQSEMILAFTIAAN
jgi:hypothetical protein